jgi:hypothetical protein
VPVDDERWLRDPICDFCAQGPVVGLIPVEDFSTTLPGGVSWDSSGSWAVCAVCETLLLTTRMDDLLARSMKQFEVEGVTDAERASALANVRAIHREFKRRWYRRGAPNPLPTTQEERGTLAMDCPVKPHRYTARTALGFRLFLQETMRRWPSTCFGEANYQNPRINQNELFKDLQGYLSKTATVIWEPGVWNGAIRGAEKVFDRVNLRHLPASYAPQLWTWPLGCAPEGLEEPDTLKRLKLSPGAVFCGMFISALYAVENGQPRWPLDLGDRHTTERLGLAACLIYLEYPLVEQVMTDTLPKTGGIDPADVVPKFRFLDLAWHGQEWCPPIYQAVQAGLHFMQLDWVGTTRHKFSWQDEKRYRKSMKGAPPDISVVTLRRPHREPEKPVGGEKGDGVEWSCQWIVSGHWKNAWCPSIQTHRPVYIDPHMKGPSDKPIRLKEGTVYRVAR